jgi:hypothetical protein
MEGTVMSYKPMEIIVPIPKNLYIESGEQLAVQTVLIVPVSMAKSDKPSIYIEGGGKVLICRAFLNECDVEEYLSIVSDNSNVDPEELHFCPLPPNKLVSSLAKISNKTKKPVKCILMLKYGGILKDAGIFWTNHEPLMV